VESIGPLVRAVTSRLDASLAVVGLGSMRGLVDGQLVRARFGAMCAIVFGGLGLVLAAGGTFAVLWLVVAQRAREIGIRMALGASPRAVGRLVMRESMRPAFAGGLAGLLLAAWLGRSLDAVLYGISSQDPTAFAATFLAVMIVAFVASWLPVRRAMATNPVAALKGS
jgi:ABC-type antimicrobial peptide transport system permease subunit